MKIVALLAAAVLALAGCSSDGESPNSAATDQPAATAGASTPGAPQPDEATGAAADDATPPPGADAGDSPDPADGPVALTDVVDYDGGLRIEIVEARAGEMSETGVGAEETDGSVAIFEIRVSNTGDAPLDVSQLSMSATYGEGEPAEWVFDSDQGIEGFFEGTLANGESQDVVAGFAVPADNLDDVTLDVSPNDPDLARAVFEGAVGS